MTEGQAHDLPETHSEVVGMKLLSEIQQALATAIDSLGGTMTKGVDDMFYHLASRHINVAVRAFIALRSENLIDGARLLVRPALEGMLRLLAVRTKPALIYRVLFDESKELDKWFSGVAKRSNEPYTPVRDRVDWQAFKKRCAAQFGAENLGDRGLSTYEAAAITDNETYYESHYRGYCHFTHGMLEAIGGHLDELMDPEDTRVMLLSAISALNVLVDMGADCPDIVSFRERFNELMTKKPDKLIRKKLSAG
jgi:uncharacterized protein DUF5677